MMQIYQDEFLEIVVQDNKVFLKTYKSGFLLKEFESILALHPRIKLTNFAVLKTILNAETPEPKEIGIYLPRVDIQISKDKMQASLYIYETMDYIKDHQEELLDEINQQIAAKNIVHGIQSINFDNINTGKACLLAIGTPPKKGDDAIVTYLELPDRKPVIREDGKADYFDMNFIFQIKQGMWLGEKIPAKEGIPGMAVDGSLVYAPPGRDVPIKYDPQSAYATEEDGKIVIRAKIDGVLKQNQGIISVNHHLPIRGDVGLETGNINFDGSVSITGTVLSGFSVVAKGDISIEAPEGVSGAKLIKSVDGDVYIRGGIFGLGETVIEAGGNIYVKHVNEANLKAHGDIVIGFYSRGSSLQANSIKIDERKGKIIGGTAVARKSIVVAISGNQMERRTELIVQSLNKQDTMLIVQERAATLKKLQDESMQIEATIGRYRNSLASLNPSQKSAFEQALKILEKNKGAMEALDREIKTLMADLRNAGNEEIHVTKEAYPGTYIQIGKKSSLLTKVTKGKFKIELGELNV